MLIRSEPVPKYELVPPSCMASSPLRSYTWIISGIVSRAAATASRGILTTSLASTVAPAPFTSISRASACGTVMPISAMIVSAAS